MSPRDQALKFRVGRLDLDEDRKGEVQREGKNSTPNALVLRPCVGGHAHFAVAHQHVYDNSDGSGRGTFKYHAQQRSGIPLPRLALRFPISDLPECKIVGCGSFPRGDVTDNRCRMAGVV